MLVLGQPEPYGSLLANLDEFSLDHWLAERFTELKQTGIEPPRGAWPVPGDNGNGLFCVRSPLGDRDFEAQVVVALVPTSEPALVPLHLGFGSWNDCPEAVVHAAVARRWRALCGAVPVAFAGDVVEYRVPHPISTREQAIEVALEQFAYCSDIVFQGTETIERLAAGLVGARHWFFWWD
jgi:uncharacterized protein DUF4253